MRWLFTFPALWLLLNSSVGLAQPGSSIYVILATTDVSCTGLDNGAASLTLLSGATPIQLAWSNTNTGNGGTGVLDTGNPFLQLNNLAPGDYQFMLTDANGSDTTLSASINEPPPLLGALQVLSNYNGFPVACANAINGRARLNASGGTPPYHYSWPSGELQMEADSLPAGNYQAVVYDAQGCSLSFPLVLNAPPDILIDLVVTGEKCLGENSGAVSIQSLTGGLPPYGIAFNQGNFGQQSTWMQLAPGSYFIDVVDDNGCIQSTAAILPTGLEFEFDAGPDQDIFSGDTIMLQPQGNHPIDTLWALPTLYAFSNNTDLFLAPRFNTTFQIVAIDNQGCRAEEQRTVTVHRKRSIYAPNVFYPGATEVQNRYFMLYDGGGIREIERLQVFDRRGRNVYLGEHLPPSQFEMGWDGTEAGRDAPADVYVWVAAIRYSDGRLEEMRGDLTLIR
ncbi:MAG: hypothetical protein IPL65_15795 [Lewinellaceae bacterium]|nr:hypothetical protein [Lewinellaceae bacterium]